MQSGTWVRHRATGQVGRVVDATHLWGARVVRLWLPAVDTIVRVAEDQIEALDAGGGRETGWRLVAAAAAARINEVLAQEDVLVSPLEGLVTPLPHQLYALSRAMAGDRVRYLFADEVGLGKTIEAGLVIRELKVRGLVRRVLVVAPMGLCTQWVQEMQTHFREDFTLVLPGQLAGVRQLGGASADENLWRRHDQVVCPVDGLKPLESRRGWSRDRVARYNRERFEDLVTAGWDLVVIDEAHRLAGSTAEVARYKLGEALAQAAPYLLLLSATPHQGKTDAFRRLMSFLDPDLFVDDSTVTQARVAPFVVRTEKRRAIDADGNALFVPRRTELRPVGWGDRTEQRELYEAVTDYVREGYNQALREKRNAVGFLMVLFQRMLTSSTRAIRLALERRIAVLDEQPEQLPLLVAEAMPAWDVAGDEEEQDFDAVVGERLAGLRSEREEVAHLVSLARRCEASAPDAKAEALLELVRLLEREESDPDLKVLVFTEFVPTQEMLAEHLRERGYTVVTLNGALNMQQRRVVQQAFRDEARVLISTDAGGEGLNLQFAHIIVNYDLPWNPMKVEQRIGRVDRIGQKRPVRAFNFALEDSVELRVREVLEEKLARILEEFGVDKLSDVLDSDAIDVDFDKLYVDAVLSPEEAAARAATFAESLRAKAKEARQGAVLLGESARPDPAAAKKIEDHQLPFWTERLVVGWLHAHRDEGAEVDRHATGWRLRWPDGQVLDPVTFERDRAEAEASELVTVEEPRVRQLLSRLPHVAPGQPVASIELDGISDKVSGTWSLWRVSLQTDEVAEHRYMPLFINDDGRVLLPTARAAWDRLIAADIDGARLDVHRTTGEAAAELFRHVRDHAETQGQRLFETMVAAHRGRLDRERTKGELAFAARRRMIDRLGLSAVRSFRLRQLDEDRAAWEQRLTARERALPDLTALVVLRIEREGTLS